MIRTDLRTLALPDTPGVYRFLGKGKRILYIGKATNLRDRVRSYGAHDLAETRGERIARMREEAVHVAYTQTDSALEALVLEAQLIKKYQPLYNVDGKDDRSWYYLLITAGESYPRVLVVRGKDLFGAHETLMKKYRLTEKPEIKDIFGPFTHGGLLKEALNIMRKIFPFYDTKVPVVHAPRNARTQLRFNRALGLYPHEEMSPKTYARTIAHLRLFLSGGKPALVKRLTREMHAYARAKRFEDAEIVKRQLRALGHIEDISLLRRAFYEESQDNASAPERIEAYDIAHQSGSNMVGAMVVFENGEPTRGAYRKFIIRSFKKSNDTGALREMLERRLNHEEWPLPKYMVLDGGTAQLSVAKKILTAFGYRIPLVSVLKDEHHRPKKILGDKALVQKEAIHILAINAEAHRFVLAFHRQKRSKTFLGR